MMSATREGSTPAALMASFRTGSCMYKAGDGNTVVYYFTDATANFSSFTAPPYSVRL